MRVLFLPLIFGLSGASAQTLTPTLLSPLPPALNETSGLLVIDGHIWTQLDSGNPAALYEIDPVSGTVLRSVSVDNATNVDWEDLATDGSWIYIGDIGNNRGSRTDLCVYRFPASELLDPAVMSVVVDTISYSYADQVDFTPASNATNWDCEAMVAMDDSLFLFTKNWENEKSYLYALSAMPGVHLAQRRDTLEAQGMMTGASYDVANGSVALCGYTGLLAPFVWQFRDLPGHGFFNGEAVRHVLQIPFGQVEGIAWKEAGNAYLSNEQNPLSSARLWEIGLEVTEGLVPSVHADLPSVVIDQAAEMIMIQVAKSDTFRIIDANGGIVLEGPLHIGKNEVSTRVLPKGSYFVNTGSDVLPVRIVIMR